MAWSSRASLCREYNYAVLYLVLAFFARTLTGMASQVYLTL